MSVRPFRSAESEISVSISNKSRKFCFAVTFLFSSIANFLAILASSFFLWNAYSTLQSVIATIDPDKMADLTIEPDKISMSVTNSIAIAVIYIIASIVLLYILVKNCANKVKAE